MNNHNRTNIHISFGLHKTDIELEQKIYTWQCHKQHAPTKLKSNHMRCITHTSKENGLSEPFYHASGIEAFLCSNMGGS